MGNLQRRLDIEHSRRPVVALTAVGRQALMQLHDEIENGRFRFQALDCPVCGARDLETVATRDRYGIACHTGVCRQCGLLQTNPYPDPPSLDWFYREVFAPLHRGSDAPTQARFAERRRKAAEIVQWLRCHAGPGDGLVIDVGCGSGGFLQGMIDAGFEGIGAEIDEDYAAWGRDRGLDIRTGTLADLHIERDISLVTYIQVLEHIVDLDEELARLKSVLKPGGMVFIEVPGPTSVPSMYNFDFLRLLQLAHAWHFTPGTLTALMHRHGFECVYVDGFVRGLYRVPRGDRLAPQPPVAEGPANLHDFIRQQEFRRMLHWRTWAIKAKALLRRIAGRAR